MSAGRGSWLRRAGWRRALQALFVAWMLLGAIGYSFYPIVLTGHRAVDAILVSAAATLLLAELVEVLGTLAYLVFFRRDSTGPA